MVTTRNLSAEVARLKNRLGELPPSQANPHPAHQGTAPANTSGPTAELAPKLAPKHKKSVLFVGDSSTRRLRHKILEQLPRNSSILFRGCSKADIGSILAQTKKAIEDNPQELQIILHCGYEDCLNFKGNEFIKSLSEFALDLKTKRPNCSLAISTVPEFTKECNTANDALTNSREELGIDILNLKIPHRGMVLRGSYSYSSVDEVAYSCAKSIARKAASLPIREKESAQPRISAEETPRTGPLNRGTRTKPTDRDRTQRAQLHLLLEGINKLLKNQPRNTNRGSQRKASPNAKRSLPVHQSQSQQTPTQPPRTALNELLELALSQNKLPPKARVKRRN